MNKEKIKDEALKQLFRLKLQQLNEMPRMTFSHPLAHEVICLMSMNFDRFYDDKKLIYILFQSYKEHQTVERLNDLYADLEKWANEKGYDYNLIISKD